MAEDPDREPDMLTRWEKAVIVGGIILALIGFATRADAARSWAVPPLPPANTVSYTPKVPIQRIGLDCRHSEYLIWGVRYCTTLRARKDSRGRWWLQPAAVIAGYNAQGRRSMRFAVAVRKDGRTVTAAGKAKRLVLRGRWRAAQGGADDTQAIYLIRWPNGRKSAVKLSPNA